MEFASEMVVRGALAGLRIEEVPTTLKPDGRSRPPHLKTWRDGWRHLKFLLMYNPRWLFFIPGLSLCGLGALLAALLFFGPLQLADNLSLDLNTFVAACFMVVVGVQLVTFGVLSRVLCRHHRHPAEQFALRLAGQAHQHGPARPQRRHLPAAAAWRFSAMRCCPGRSSISARCPIPKSRAWSFSA